MLKSEVVKTSLEVGFTEASPVPERLLRYRGQVTRAIGAMSQFPFEDAQFECVLMEPSAVTRQSVKEANRVLRPSGRLHFILPEKTGKQEGFTVPDVYSVIRHGFDIVEVERTPWWHFGFGGRTLKIAARKKNWRELDNTYRPYV